MGREPVLLRGRPASQGEVGSDEAAGFLVELDLEGVSLFIGLRGRGFASAHAINCDAAPSPEDIDHLSVEVGQSRVNAEPDGKAILLLMNGGHRLVELGHRQLRFRGIPLAAPGIWETYFDFGQGVPSGAIPHGGALPPWTTCADGHETLVGSCSQEQQRLALR